MVLEMVFDSVIRHYVRHSDMAEQTTNIGGM